MSTDVRLMTPFMKQVLYNIEVIAVNQDPLAKAGDLVGSWNCPEGRKACQVINSPSFYLSPYLPIYLPIFLDPSSPYSFSAIDLLSQ